MDDEPYAVTVLYLSGQVIVQLDEEFWVDTPGPLREKAIRAHVEEVRAEFLALGSPAALVVPAVRVTRAALMLGSGSPAIVLGITQGLAAVTPIGALTVITAAVGLVPHSWITRAIRPLVELKLRRLLSRMGRS
jgi:hypothetical protein